MIKKRIEYWENSLLDLGKRNKLINFKESVRSSIEIIYPQFEKLFDSIVLHEKELSFSQLKYEVKKVDDEVIVEKHEIPGDLKTNRNIEDQIKTLKAIRNKSRTIFQEQGVNVLYLCFGFLNWNDLKDKTTINKSPLLLVPLNLVQRSIIDPFKMYLAEDEIVLNPTLCHKLQSDCNVLLPAYDHNEENLNTYLSSIDKMIKKHSWSIEYRSTIGIFLFHKINMFKDIQSKREQIPQNKILKGLCGCKINIPLPSTSLENYDHDKNIQPIDTYQVLQADSSQQDAVLYAKMGYSFVLQGPPGTGKSQTIANIISENLAAGKKVLFVSDKMAALEVVYKRLEETGLSDYCLTLHNPRIKKTEFLSDIKGVLERKKIKTNGNAKRELLTLANQKQKLIEYNESLHKKIQPLNKSLYEACCEYFSLPDVSHRNFNSVDSQNTSEENLTNRLTALEEYVNCVSHLSIGISSNPWHGFKQFNTTHDEREEIKIFFKKILKHNTTLIDLVEKINQAYHLDLKATYSNIENLLLLFRHLFQMPVLFPEHYLQVENFQEIFNKIQSNIQLCEEISKLREQLNADFSPSIYSLDGDALLSLLNTNTVFLEKHLSTDTYPTKNEILLNLQFIAKELEDLKDYPEKISSIFEIVEDKYDLFFEKNNITVDSIKEVLSTILHSPKCCKSWLDKDKHAYISNCLDQCCKHWSNLRELETQVDGIFDSDIYSEDINTLLRKFRTTYSSHSRWFQPQYYKDKQIIQQYVKSNYGKLDHNKICELLEALKTIQSIKAWFQKNYNKLQVLFDLSDDDHFINWLEVKKDFILFTNVMNSMYITINNSNASLFLKNETEIKEIQQFEEFLSECEEKKVTQRLVRLLSSSILKEGFKSLSECGTLNKLFIATKELLKLNTLLEIHENTRLSFDFYYSKLSLLVNYQKMDSEFLRKFDDLKNVFGYLFNEHQTDWNMLLSVFQWLEDWKKLLFTDLILYSNIEKTMVEVPFRQNIESMYKKIVSTMEDIKPLIQWLYKKFHQQSISTKCELQITNNRIQECMDQFYLLNEYIIYSSLKNNCNNQGLKSYIDFLEKEEIPFDQIVATYKKLFITDWIDNSLDQLPSLLNFQKSSFKRVLDSFEESDNKHLSITPLRIIEQIQKNLPDNFDITSPDSEIGILKREMLKKRRIMPLRLLFSKIPNLLKAYKPCFMMSPLSVSLFLESDEYKFDTVIFDEASQVRTEDAVGAIFRGKQVIVCGDQHQLPPTSFFVATLNENEYDDEDDTLEKLEEDDSGSYESVLEECLKILPEITLRWHYRSRDEELIAFSNKNIYDNRLITFPSNVQKRDDFGIELVYCENGRYDKGRSRTNKVEAQKVAELVFKHFDQYPDRSIGVVTFNTSQQNAVDTEISRMRIERQAYEEYFDENRNEPFFIKNLETVQGDERDTIILCVGYGKHDPNKPLSMVFGPLNKIGGERRLNVAITRAKCNIKIVTSITSFDFNLTKTNSKGVKLLRDYIAFAENPCTEEDKSITDIDEDQESMEQFICTYLDQKNIQYKKRVGFSDYKIDIAIPCSQNPDHFLLAIETEGEQYVSARTERERYLTRHIMLKSMGWNVEHIWTPTLLQDTDREMKRLIRKIRTLDNNHTPFQQVTVPKPEDKPINNLRKDQDNQSQDFFDSPYCKIDEEDDKIPFGLKYYNITTFPDHEMQMRTCIQQVLHNESPIHIDLLCQRIAPKFDRKKVTKLFKDKVQQELEYIDYEYNKRSGFIYKNDASIQARIPSENNPETLRSIDHLPIEEIMIAIEAILKYSFSIPEDGLIDTVARVFGYNRTGEHIQKKLKHAIKKMYECNLIKATHENNVSLVYTESHP